MPMEANFPSLLLFNEFFTSNSGFRNKAQLESLLLTQLNILIYAGHCPLAAAADRYPINSCTIFSSLFLPKFKRNSS